MNKVLVVGLDAATWNVILPLTRAGKLPTFARLMAEGSYGELMSCFPPSTFPAWKCYSTGKNPAKLGAAQFLQVDLDRRRVILNDNSSHYRGKEIWDYLGEKQIVCGVLGMPTTYPPKAINGFMVSFTLGNNPDFTYPNNLAGEIKDKFHYKLVPEHLFNGDKDRAISEYREIVRQRFEVARYLLKVYQPQFFHLTIFELDPIQHALWKYMEAGHPLYGGVIEDFYALIDEELERLLGEFLDQESSLFVMSDHGCASLKGRFHLVPWLLKHEHVCFRPTLSALRILPKLGLSLENLFAVAEKLNISAILRRTLPFAWQKRVYQIIPSKKGSLGSGSGGWEGLIDWKKSRVIPIGGIYINSNLLPPGSPEYERFRDSLISQMAAVKSPDGNNLFARIYKREEVCSGPHLSSIPDILEIASSDYDDDLQWSQQEWDFSRSPFSATHRLEGIFLAYGPYIKKGQELPPIQIYDLAPTILHLFGLPLPPDLDGRVVTEIFEAGSPLLEKAIAYQERDEARRVRQRIKELKHRSKI